MPGELRDPAGDRQSSRFVAGSFYAWWRGDPLPTVEPIAGFDAAAVDTPDGVSRLARLSGVTVDAIDARRQQGNRAYVATVAGEPLAYGWSAARAADIGELGIALKLAPTERYLWDFLTLPAARGRGVYPHLLQAVIRQELLEGVERVWIGHDADNVASARGILRAGFRPVGELVVLGPGRFALTPSGPVDRADRASALLGVPLDESG